MKKERIINFGRLVTIAEHFLYDALVSSVMRFYLLLLVLIVLFSSFAAQLAVIEQDAFRLALSSAMVRLLAVAVVIVQGCASLNEESRNGQLELTVALDVSRSQYIVGRALGAGLFAILLALLAVLALGWWSPGSQLALWGLGLACELVVMATFTLFVAVTFTSLATGVLLSLAFYLLSRFIEAFVLMAGADGGDTSSSVLVWISWLVPNFGRYSQSSWLIYGDAALALLIPVVVESIVICALLLLATLVDFHRREI